MQIHHSRKKRFMTWMVVLAMVFAGGLMMSCGRNQLLVVAFVLEFIGKLDEFAGAVVMARSVSHGDDSSNFKRVIISSLAPVRAGAFCY